MSINQVKPFLIVKDEHGDVRLTVRETRYNSQGYPLVSSNLIGRIFTTATAARAYASEEYGAKTGEFATK